MELATARTPFDPTKTSARRRFRGYKSEPKRATREAEVQENETLRQMKTFWRSFDFKAHMRRNDIHTIYQAMLPIVEKLQYTKDDVEAFSYSLEEFQHERNFSEKAGFFLSALINIGKDRDYVIHTSHLARPPDFLGIYNEKNITVDGDVGMELGEEMTGGSITVNGDIGKNAGHRMKDGSITVTGNAGHFLGSFMKGGSISVAGDAGIHVGWEMKDGDIIVEGNAGDNVGTDMKGGSITIGGNPGIYVGTDMKGGSITIGGNAGHEVGRGMKGGSIIVKGNVGMLVGNRMGGGEIHLYGEFEEKELDSPYLVQGKIYHKGKLIVNK
jgi:formylmethanofuran dehydrogenase subunit C